MSEGKVMSTGICDMRVCVPADWTDEQVELLRRLRSTGVPLSAAVGRKPVRGLLSGFNEAFYIDTRTRDSLVLAHAGSEKLVRRFLRGRDVQRWFVKWADQWHIVIPSSQNHDWPWSSCKDEADAERCFESSYPSIYGHLKRFEPQLRAREDQGRFWWELRSCDYYGLFDQPKLLVQCIAYHSQFAIDSGGHVINNKAIFIPSGDLYILAVLNSRVTWWIVSRVFQHMKDEGLSVDVQFLTDLPIPDATEALQDTIRGEVRSFLSVERTEDGSAAELLRREHRINDLVEQAFGLTPRERQLLVNSLPPRDPLVVLEEQVPVEAVSADAPLTASQVNMIKAMQHVLAFLKTTKKRVQHDILEAGLALMANDGLRRSFLSKRPVTGRTAGRRHPTLLSWLQLALEQLNRKGGIVQELHEDMPFISMGPTPPDLGDLSACVKKAEEALRVITKLGEQQARQAVEESVDDASTLVPI